MEEDADVECCICNRKYDKWLHLPVVWRCCKAQTGKECAEKWIQTERRQANGSLVAPSCPYCRMKSDMNSFAVVEGSALIRIFKKLDLEVLRQIVPDCPVNCRDCGVEKMSFCQLFFAVDDASILHEHSMLSPKDQFTFLFQAAVCLSCLHKRNPAKYSVTMTMKDLFYCKKSDLIASTKDALKGQLSFAHTGDAIKVAVYCWRWMFAFQCDKVSSLNAAGFFKYLFENIDFWTSLSQAPQDHHSWLFVTISSLVKILAMFTKNMVDADVTDIAVAEDLFRVSTKFGRQLSSFPIETGLLRMDIRKKVLYPAFNHILRLSCEEKLHVLTARYEIVGEILDFETSEKNSDMINNYWTIMQAELVRLGEFREPEVIPYASVWRAKILKQFYKYFKTTRQP